MFGNKVDTATLCWGQDTWGISSHWLYTLVPQPTCCWKWVFLGQMGTLSSDCIMIEKYYDFFLKYSKVACFWEMGEVCLVFWLLLPHWHQRQKLDVSEEEGGCSSANAASSSPSQRSFDKERILQNKSYKDEKFWIMAQFNNLHPLIVTQVSVEIHKFVSI